jgi:hypothetical protein
VQLVGVAAPHPRAGDEAGIDQVAHDAWGARSVIWAASARSRSRASGSRAMSSSTRAWLVSRVHVRGCPSSRMLVGSATDPSWTVRGGCGCGGPAPRRCASRGRTSRLAHGRG